MQFLKNRVNAFGYALSGLVQAFKQETHLKIMGGVGLLVVGLARYCGLTKHEWLAVLGCIALVICLELLNSAIEKLCDRLLPDIDPKVKYIKDVAAGAVLVASIFSLITGILIFLPYALALFN
ncbi:MAG: diacylglycerol kinase family protein [Bacteroidota bacterium]